MQGDLFAVIFDCSDSRLAEVIIFDQCLGEALVARTAGHALDDAVLGSLEYNVSVLNVQLIVVLCYDRLQPVRVDRGRPRGLNLVILWPANASPNGSASL